MKKHSKSAVIQIKEMDGGRVAREFSSLTYRITNQEVIENLAALCLSASNKGQWPQVSGGSVGKIGTWPELASTVAEDLRKRLAREGSRKNAEGHLKEIAKFRGEETEFKLEAWAFDRDPITQP